MDTGDLKKASKTTLAKEIATRQTDPRFYSALTVLPNPDTVLRKLGKSGEAFDAIVSDAHVIGELRSVRSSLLGYESRLQAGGETPADARALELCEQFMEQRPAPGLRWPDVIWNMAQAVFRGYQVHEVVWRREGQYLMPASVLDRPGRRFVYGTDNTLRLVTRSSMIEGEELGPYKWLVTRHMPSHDNPYGVALFSSCFWPYTFKHSGFRYFVKFCEKYGIPWAIGKYPQGTPKAEQDALADALAQMVEDAVAAIPGDGSVELLEASSSGQLVHERLIDICNREMSKALTSQTLATEIQGDGSRAASQTHREREKAVNESDRAIVEDTMNELLGWITELNIQGARPPRFEFFEETEARQEWVDVFDKARHFVDIPKAFAHERLQIPMPAEGDEVLPAGGGSPAVQFAAQAGGTDVNATSDQDELDAAISNIDMTALDAQMRELLAPVFSRLEQGDAPEVFLGWLAEQYPDADAGALQEKLGKLIWAAQMWGRLNGEG
jgi:phage gp29-like protein